MITSEVQRTLVKSPPELWSELSDPESLARHLGELGEVAITRVRAGEPRRMGGRAHHRHGRDRALGLGNAGDADRLARAAGGRDGGAGRGGEQRDRARRSGERTGVRAARRGTGRGSGPGLDDGGSGRRGGPRDSDGGRGAALDDGTDRGRGRPGARRGAAALGRARGRRAAAGRRAAGGAGAGAKARARDGGGPARCGLAPDRVGARLRDRERPAGRGRRGRA